MAKAVKQAAPVEQAPPEVKQEAPAKMSRKDAEAIVARYRGINGVKIAELEEAKKVLKG